jgi:alpha-galactosidase
MVAIAEDVCDLSPTALFFSYSNPMTPLCRAVRKVTDAPLVGLCSGVDGTARHLAKTLGVTPDEVSYAAAGINHLTWFTEFQVNGKDAMPDLHRVAAEKPASLEHGPEVDRKVLEEVGPFSWQLFETFGAYPAPGDRHVIEFFPHLFRDGKYYGKTLGVDVYNFESWVEFCRKVTDEMRLVIAEKMEGLPREKLAESEVERFARAIAASTAEMADQGTNRKRVAPEILEARAKAQTRMSDLLDKARQRVGLCS